MTEVHSSCQAQVCQLVRYLNCSIGRQGSNGAELRSRREQENALDGEISLRTSQGRAA